MCIKVYNNYNNEAGQLPAAPGPAGAGPPAAVRVIHGRASNLKAAAAAARVAGFGHPGPQPPRRESPPGPPGPVAGP